MLTRFLGHFRFGTWLRQHYWKAMLGFGLLLGACAVIFYLGEIAVAVIWMVDLLERQVAAQVPNTQTIRNLATGIAVLLGALAAAATLIFQLVRVWINERTTTAAEEGLITDRINKAVEGLGAEKTVNTLGRSVRYTQGGVDYSYFDWIHDQREPPDHDTDKDGKKLLTNDPWSMHGRTLPNLEVRIGAIYALERIAQDSLRDHIQIMEILCAYIRENVNAGSRKPPTDIQVALEVIGRRRPDQVAREKSVEYKLDLQSANIQGCDLSGKNFERANLWQAELQGANLIRARLEGVHLTWARLEGAHLIRARLEGAHLTWARLEGANLSEARLEGANLDQAQIDTATEFKAATLLGAGFREVDLSHVAIDTPIYEAFGDGSVKLPGDLEAGKPPLEHWPTEILNALEFRERWRAWQAKIGYRQLER